MSMPSAEIEMVMSLLSDIRKDNSHEHELIHEKLNTIAANGTAISRQNQNTIDDHEERLRDHERYINRQAGQVAVIGSGAAILVLLGKFLLTKVI